MERQKKPSQIEINQMIKEEGHIKKFVGIAPEGFFLVHEKTLEDLKNWYVWEKWRDGKISLEELNKNNFDNT